MDPATTESTSTLVDVLDLFVPITNYLPRFTEINHYDSTWLKVSCLISIMLMISFIIFVVCCNAHMLPCLFPTHSTLRIYWFPHHSSHIFPTSSPTKIQTNLLLHRLSNDRRSIINLLSYCTISSRCSIVNLLLFSLLCLLFTTHRTIIVLLVGGGG